MSNSLEPDQARHFVGPDLGPNFLQRLSADDTSRRPVNANPLSICKVLFYIACLKELYVSIFVIKTNNEDTICLLWPGLSAQPFPTEW